MLHFLSDIYYTKFIFYSHVMLLQKKVIKRQLLVVQEVPSCPFVVRKHAEDQCACNTAP